MKGKHRLRRLLVGLLIALACLMTVGATVAVWARAEVLDTDRWIDTVGPLIEQPEVVDALSTRAAAAIVDGLDIENRVRTALVGFEALPDQVGVLAGPITDAIQSRLQLRLAALLETDRAQELWVQINRVAHTAVVALLTGDTREGISVSDGTVTLDLVPLIELAIGATEDLLSDVLGRPIDLPDPGAVDPANVAAARDRIETALGVQLPEDFGQIVVFQSDRLAAAQDVVTAVNRWILIVIVLAVILMGAAIALSLNRRRTLIQLGFGVFLAFLAARLAIRAIQSAVVNSVSEGQRGAVREVAGSVFGSLLAFTTFLFAAGLLVGIAAYLWGRPAWLVRAREHLRLAPERQTEFGAWVAGHRDAVRFGGLAVALLALFAVDLSWASVLWIALVLVVFQIGVSYLADTPAPEPEAAP